jgi:phage recombination protein Bet
MPEANLAVMTPHTPVVKNDWDTPENRALILRTVAPGLTEAEAALFFHVAKQRHLDPLQRQIHAVKRRSWNKSIGGTGGWEETMTIQTGIDGYRSIANRTKHYMPSDKNPLIEDPGTPNLRITVWVKKYDENTKTWHEFSATAWYREFVQTRKDENKRDVPNAMWAKMPINQLTKCAEALALRKGWPEELGGIYVDEEMQQHDSPQILPPEAAPKQDKTQREMGTLKASTTPNRGHGNEGTARTEPSICAECRQSNGQHLDDCKQNPKNKKTQSTKGAAEQWKSREGHDPKKHVSFQEVMQLFDLQRELIISEPDMKSFLDREFEIQHRHLIPKEDLPRILEEARKQFTKVASAPPEPPTDEEPPSDLAGLFDR